MTKGSPGLQTPIMEISEHILNSAISELQDGKSIAEVLAIYPEHTEELLPLLEVASMGLSIPKVVVPTPIRRHKFAETALYPSMWSSLITFMRVAIIPIGLVAVLFGGKVVVNAANDSLPGSPLYSLKRATEQARLNLTFDQDKVATLHVELTQKRLDEVKQAINNENEEQEKAAIEALQEQSDKTFATVPQVAAANALTKNDQKLLDNLVAINKEQKEVLSAVKDENQSKAAADTALNSTKENGKQLAVILATVHEQTLVDLSNKVSVTGEYTQLVKNKLTIEGSTFTITDETEILDADGAEATIKDIGGKLSVVGEKKDDVLIAKQITILVPAPVIEVKPQVKGAATTTSTAKPSAPIVQPPAVPATDPNQATGTFIVEPAAEQYAP
jgi:hypothetical protein